jgi:hypothetical protein
LSGILDNAIPSADIVKREVAEGMDYLVAQRCGHGECPAVDGGTCGGGRKRACMARSAADLVE